MCVLLRIPGVYEPQGDTFLLREALRCVTLPPHAEALDACTGNGLIALTAARLGAARVLAVDSSPLAVASAKLNARLAGLPVRVRLGDFLTCAAGRRFDLVTANPPYVPCPPRPPARVGVGSLGPARAWHAGEDGRRQLDRLCAAAPDLLTDGGVLLLVHSALCGVDRTLRDLRDRGLDASVAQRRRQPFGPVLHAHARWLEERGLIAPGQRDEELVVIRAVRRSTPA